MLKDGNKGITLVALVLTIIILLILAGISISALTNTGIFEKAEEAKRKTEEAENEEQKTLEEYEIAFDENTTVKLVNDKMNKVLSTKKNVKIEDEKGNIFVLPAGFKIVVDDTTDNAKTVDKGIVVEDATVSEDGTKTSTNGSQFVWIPVGTIKKLDGTEIGINLNRYIFPNGIPIAQGEEGIAFATGAYQELEVSSKGNVVAKSIVNFKKSVSTNGGYYIGRYEARTSITRTANDIELTQVTERGDENVYFYVTQKQAADLSKNMYNSDLYTSDLMNSYAWDTAIVFLQSCGKNLMYSRQNSLNDEVALMGTNNLGDVNKIDIQCNVYDMASNLREYSTETVTEEGYPCSRRGGLFGHEGYVAGSRENTSTNYSYIHDGFRVLLYL